MADTVKNKIETKLQLLYVIPLFSSYSLFIILKGSFYDETHEVLLKGHGATFIGIIFLLIAISMVYDFILSVYKLKLNSQNLERIFKIVLSSPFLYIWLCLLIYPVVIYYMRYEGFKYIYIFLLIICFYLQVKFNKKFKLFLNEII